MVDHVGGSVWVYVEAAERAAGPATLPPAADTGLPTFSLTAEAREACLAAGWLAARLGGGVAVWVFAGRRPGGISPEGQPLALEVSLVPEVSAPLRGLSSEVLVTRDESPTGFEPRFRALTMTAEARRRSAERAGPQMILFPASRRAAGVAATLAALLDTGLVSHCAEFAWGESDPQTGPPASGGAMSLAGLKMFIPAFGGFAAIICPSSRPILVYLAPGFGRRMGLRSPAPTPGKPGHDSAQVQQFGGPRVMLVEPPTEALMSARTAPRVARVAGARETPRPDGEPGRPDEPLGRPTPGGGPPLKASPIVVGGGAGAAKPEVWTLVQALADRLGAAVGATRPAVDEGATGESQMIGQSGLSVSSDLYVALGVSGDLQHTVGVEGAGKVVAVNRDPRAPIFSRADIGVAARLEEFLPLLMRELDRLDEGTGPSR